jgi:3-oxoacyl-[acyl-carrier protein] reductase
MQSPTPRGTTLIFGGTGAVGSALARRLRASGAEVTLAARTESSLVQLALEIDCQFVVCDATSSTEVANVVSSAAQHPAGLSGIAHCVGSILLKSADRTTDADWDETIVLNLTSAFYVVREATKAMRSSGGSIVLCSSAAARTGLTNHDAIAAAKAGVIGLTLAAAASAANRQIRVNCVAPGLVQSGISSAITANSTSLAASTAMHPLGRIGQGDDVAAAIEFLLDPTNSWVTGQVLGVDGGLGTVRPRVTA